MSNPEVICTHRWISEYEQQMERRQKMAEGRAPLSFEEKPIDGPLLSLGFSFKGKDGKVYGGAIIVGSFPKEKP